jgi:outer membrane biosynthesis protein TonB
MGKGAILSGLLHLAVVLLAVFGLPWLYDTNEVLQATPVSVISEAQFAELKNQKPPAQQKKPDQPKDKEIPPAPKAPDVAQPEPEPEPPPEPEPQQAAEPPPQPQPPPEPPQQAEQQQPAVQPEPPPEPPPQVVTPEPPPQPKPEPVQPPEPQVAEAQPKPVPPKKPTPPKKKDEPKKKEDTKQKEPKEEVALDDFLKNVEKKLKKNQKKSQPQPQQQQAALPQDNYDGPPLSEGEKDMIREQVRANWITDGGMQGIEDMIVVLNVQMNPDGSVVSADIDRSSSNGYPTWPIFADSCRRAVLKSSPLRMPPEKPYAAWRFMKLRFSARELMAQ